MQFHCFLGGRWVGGGKLGSLWASHEKYSQWDSNDGMLHTVV